MAKRINNRVAELLALKARREGRTITQSTAAAELGIPNSTLNRWYHNDIIRFDYEMMLKLMAYFECDLNELIVVEEMDDEGQSKAPLLATA